FQNSLTLANIEPIIQDPENPLTVLLARERNLIAEASVQHNRTPKPLPLNNEVLTVLAKEQVKTAARLGLTHTHTHTHTVTTLIHTHKTHNRCI
uniref:Uncharacterized protein n=1 Tax=Callorhinchus milii TaxID=7868 RepID=A0A4W3H318_CALMI